jgi:OmpA-OmpF porin, OOP family
MSICPTVMGALDKCDFWYSPTNGTPDYYNSCAVGDPGVPQNIFGWQEARTGDGNVGCHANTFNGSNVREHLQIQLTQPLENNIHYEVEFYISRADSSSLGCNNIGAYLSDTPISAGKPQTFYLKI